MSVAISIILLLVGLGLVIYFAEKLVKGVVGTSIGFGVSAFVIGVVFIGFDPENLAVGAVGSYEDAAGIALGSIVGAAMVAVGLAFGVTALIAPMRFGQAPRAVLSVPIAMFLLFAGLSWDGLLSRADGALLLAGFATAVVALVLLGRQGLDIRPSGEVAETLEGRDRISRWRSLGLLVLSFAGIVIGSEMLVTVSERIIARLGLSETFFGMVLLAFFVSVEELARELPAALKGRPDISYGNVVGSVLAFFGFNAGIVSLVRPVSIPDVVLTLYLPVCGATILATTVCVGTRAVSRPAGSLLVLLYLVFVLGGIAKS